MCTQEVGGDLSQWIIAAPFELLEMKEGGGGDEKRHVETGSRKCWRMLGKLKLHLFFFFFLFLAPEAQELRSLDGTANGPSFLGIFQSRHI